MVGRGPNNSANGRLESGVLKRYPNRRRVTTRLSYGTCYSRDNVSGTRGNDI